MGKDLTALQGTWNIVALETDGQTIGGAMLSGSKIIVSGSRFTTTAMGATYDGTIKVDDAISPKTFDLTFTAGPEKGNTNYGIYELDGDTWRICLTTRGKARPVEFATRPGTGLALETLKREIAGSSAGTDRGGTQSDVAVKKSPTTAAVPSRMASSQISELEGEWQMVSGISDGAQMDPQGVKYGRRVSRGDLTTVLFGPQVYFRAQVTLDASKTPKTIDYGYTEGVNAGKTQPGIYELDGNSLKICVAATGQARPADFSTSAGDGRTLTSWTLIKK